MKKVNNLLFGIIFLSSLVSADDCIDETKPDVQIKKGEIEISKNIDLTFDEASSNEDILELKNVRVTSCENSSVWALTAENAQLIEKNLTIQNTKLKIFDVPVFWLGEVSLNEDESFNIPNLGVTDSSLDISYKFKTKTENSQFILEPIYSKSSFGLSMNFLYDNGKNNFNFKSLAIDDENSSWVYDIDSTINLNEFISITLDYSDISGNSLIQNYGYRYLDINRRSLDLKQSIGISAFKDNRSFSVFSDNFLNIGALRPVSHSKDYVIYDRYFNVSGWNIELNSEFAKFNNNTSADLVTPYQVYDSLDRYARDYSFSKVFNFKSFDYSSRYLLTTREYKINSTGKKENSNNLATQQAFSFLEDKSLKIGLIWSTFGEESGLPIIDSYPLIQMFADAGADLISFHPEASDDVDASIALIKKLGCKVGFAVNPAEDLSYVKKYINDLDLALLMSVNPGFGGQKFIESVLPKITETRSIIDECSNEIRLEVDGGINPQNIKNVCNAGADTFVLGSAIFNTDDYANTITDLRHHIS